MTSGCELEYPMDGEICMDEEHPQLSKILLGGGVSCSREDCLSSDHCCTELEIDNNLRKNIFQAFDYNICPKGSDIATCIKGEKEYYCSHGCPSDLSAFHMISCKNGISECIDGYTDCDGDIKNGCEYDLSNHVVSCKDNRIIECEEGYADCDTKPRTGCEYNLISKHVVTCINDAIMTCENGYSDCDNDIDNGCEYILENMHALSCHNKQVVCKNGWENCNNNYRTGCITDITSDVENCGECNHKCALDQYCNNGTCEKSPCSSDMIPCGSSKVCVPKDLGHLRSCDLESNTMICADSYANCNGNLEDGCETFIHGSDPNHCGGCDSICSIEHVSNSLATACVAGTCKATACAAGYRLSNGTCVPCSDGEYGANNVCTRCPAGTVSSKDHTKCTPCNAGTYSTLGATTCTSCGNNQISTGGASSCTPCGNGTYANDTHTTCFGCTNANQCPLTTGATQMQCNSGICKAASCGAGYYLNNSSCVMCAPGTYSHGGTLTSCNKCSSGTISSIGQSQCTQCETAFITTDNKTCVPCTAGTTTSGNNHTSCVKCSKDQYSLPGTGCLNCPDGMHSDIGSSSCFQCVSNSDCDLIGNASSMQCLDNKCKIASCQEDFYLHDNTCYELHANLIDSSCTNTCRSTNDFCINNYITWMDEICIPRNQCAFNFDFGLNVDDRNTENPKTHIYVSNSSIYTYNNTKIAQIYKGSLQDALDHILNNSECKSYKSYSSSVNISTDYSGCSASNYYYSICIQVNDKDNHSEPYYYAAIIYYRYSYGHLLLWRKVDS